MTDQLPDLTCPDCGSVMPLQSGSFGRRYGCTTSGCGATHGCKPDGSPLGTPADKATRQARVRAHYVFDRLWKGPERTMSRAEAYRLLQDLTGLPPDQAHIARLDREQCLDLIEQLLEQQDQ